MAKHEYKYTLDFEESALSALETLPKDIRRQIGYGIDLLQRDWTGDIKKLVGQKNEYRLKVGKFRVLFELEGQAINVYAVKDRKDAYGR